MTGSGPDPIALASARQIAAADPARSSWISANAGSGKTRVLTERVARLLLAGTDPQNILCLTYTKAAAGEMQNRLFQQLGGWAMADDTALADALHALGVPERPDAATLDAARRLFASAVETPGGLKIQTIHAFCAALLRRFPLEAGVSPQFAELDDRSGAALRGAALDAIADGPDAAAIDGVARYVSGAEDGLDTLALQVLRHRDSFTNPLDRDGALAAAGLPAGYDGAALEAEFLDGGDPVLLADLVLALAKGSSNDVKAADKLRPACGRRLTVDDLPLLEQVFLFGDKAAQPFGAKIGKFPTAASQKGAAAALMPDLEGLMQRVEAARPTRLALAAAERTLALHGFAAAFLPEIAARKARGGWLDFEDLILRARDLLADPSVAAWVLYKLDGGIDHILVDEAQDTSPVQWELIRRLSAEFGAVEGDRRTLFVVGDRKQSIYSFQGADPDAMAGLHDDFRDRFAAVGHRLTDHELEHSFRSAGAILRAVDATFAGDAADGLGDPPRHAAAIGGLPGRVDLWPVEPTAEKEEDSPWHEPLDRTSARHHHAVLADRIAEFIAGQIAAGTPIRDGDAKQDRPIHAGDVLILVQRRATLFHEILRACKQRHLPVAGADRLILAQDLAVQDLLSLLAFLSLQDDDLALAETLRSPLFGWSEADLYRIAQPRRGLLWAALRADPAAGPTLDVLHDLRARADYLRPYDLLERILVRHDGRRKLLARLGPDREEAIDALLGLALDYEQTEPPSLTGFLEWFHADDAEVKRQAEAAGSRLRVMTVHGAKGLEAPLVILPDSADRKDRPPDPVMPDDSDRPVWLGGKATLPPALAPLHEDARRRDRQERRRLLYVAMTRAEQWLVVCAGGEVKDGNGSWYETVAAGLSGCGAVAADLPGGPGMRLESGDWPPAVAETVAGPKGSVGGGLPDWALQPAPTVAAETRPLTPSDLPGAKALCGEAALEAAAAMRRGTWLHLLLEHMPDYPESAWAETGAALLLTGDDRPSPAEAAEVLAEAVGVLTNPGLRFLFGPGTLAEVAISAPLPVPPGRLRGAIDRLVIDPDRVLAVDFKSNAIQPDTPEQIPDGILAQLGAYAAALEQVYPGRRIETAVLWTRSATLMPAPTRLTEAAWRQAAGLIRPGGHPAIKGSS